MKYVYIMFALITICSCQRRNTNSEKNISNQTLNTNDSTSNTFAHIDTSQAKEWLANTIIEFFNSSNNDMEKITTTQYAEFKNDAMNVDLGLDESLTLEQFNTKWSKIYNIDTHPIQTGFLISGQDWGKISIEHISVSDKHNTNPQKAIFKVIIADNEFNVKYNREIEIIENQSQYLINDVVEYD